MFPALTEFITSSRSCRWSMIFKPRALYPQMKRFRTAAILIAICMANILGSYIHSIYRFRPLQLGNAVAYTPNITIKFRFYFWWKKIHPDMLFLVTAILWKRLTKECFLDNYNLKLLNSNVDSDPSYVSALSEHTSSFYLHTTNSLINTTLSSSQALYRVGIY